MKRAGRVMRGAVVTTLLGLAACAQSGAAAGRAPASAAPAAGGSPGTPPPATGAPSAKSTPPRPGPLVPSGTGATVYASTAPADTVKAPPDPLRDAIRAAVRESARRAGVPTPE